MQKELFSLYRDAQKGKRFITRYAATDHQEYFAEAFTARLMQPRVLLQRDPKMYEFVTRFMRNHGILD